MDIKIELTWSKIMALIVLGVALYLCIQQKDTQPFTYALPFIVFLITGKQYFQMKDKINAIKPKT